MNSIRLTAAALAASALAVVSAPAFAAQPAGIQLAQAEAYSDEKIESFAVAAIEIRKIRNDYVTRIQQAESEARRQELAEQATGEMMAAVEATPGLTVEEYNAIIQSAAEDEALVARINEEMQAAQ